MNRASALPPIATVIKTVTAAQGVYASILATPSRTVNIPPKIRQLMRAHNKTLVEFLISRRGQQIYAILQEEQMPANRTVPASVTRPAPKMKTRAARA